MNGDQLGRFYVELTNPDEMGLKDSRLEEVFALAHECLLLRSLDLHSDEALAFARSQSGEHERLKRDMDEQRRIYEAVADAVNDVATEAHTAFVKAGLTDIGDWDGDNIVEDVKRGIVDAVERLARMRSSTREPMPPEGWNEELRDQLGCLRALASALMDALACEDDQEALAKLRYDPESSHYCWHEGQAAFKALMSYLRDTPLSAIRYSMPPSFNDLADVHRGWCNYCRGNVEVCRGATKYRGCTLSQVEAEIANTADSASEK